jgi:hypothetical protein
MDDVLRPYHHTAPVAGRMTTFCMLEYPKEFPPAVIEVDGVRWVRVDAKTETERDGR